MTRFQRYAFLAGLLGSVAISYPALAKQDCQALFKDMQNGLQAGQADAILGVWSSIESGQACGEKQRAHARKSASFMLARLSRSRLDAGDIDGAEAVVHKAPGLHWSVQMVRGDIAAKRGQRSEAARMYNSALDTIGDAGLTEQSPQLVPVAEKLAQLAQENMMLAGTMEASVSRGGEATGVMRMVSRGIVQEKVPSVNHEKIAKVEDYKEPEKAKHKDEYKEPEKQVYKEPEKEVYKEPEKEVAYNVVAEVGKKIKGVFVPIKFDFDSDRLDATGTREAIRLAEFLKKHHVPYVTIVGHTDEVGHENYNLDLSKRRAHSLKTFLLSDGVKAEIRTIGRGEYEPPRITDASIYSEDERRAIARRIEIDLHDY